MYECAYRDFIAIKMALTQMARLVDGQLVGDVASFRVTNVHTFIHAI